MSIWLAFLDTPPARDADYIAVPAAGAFNPAHVRTISELRQRLRAEQPDLPPESLQRQAEQWWRLAGDMKNGDIIGVVATTGRGDESVAFAEITGPVRVAPDSLFQWHMPAAWFPDAVPASAFSRQRGLLSKGDFWLKPVDDVDHRHAIRKCLPLPANRFARWKWLAVALLALQMLSMVAGMLKR